MARAPRMSLVSSPTSTLAGVLMVRGPFALHGRRPHRTAESNDGVLAVGIASPAADESGLDRGTGLSGRTADQLNQAEDHQQDDDEYDDEQPGGMAPEDEDQCGEGHGPDPEAPT